MAQALVESAIANNKIMGKRSSNKIEKGDESRGALVFPFFFSTSTNLSLSPPLPPSPSLSLANAVFSKSYCPYCVKAKDAIRSALGQPGVAATTVWELDERPNDGAEIQAVLGKITGATTVPRVFVNGQFLGGGDDTARAAKDGTLVKLAREAGIAV